MDTNSLKTIVVVSKTLNIKKAADYLHTSSSTVSRIITKIEQEYNIKLFYRKNNNQLIITDDGLNFVQYANIAINNENEFIMSLKSKNPCRELNIGLSRFFTSHSFNLYLDEFVKSNQNITISIMTKQKKELLEMLSNNLIDIAIIVSDTFLSIENLKCISYQKHNVSFYTSDNNYKELKKLAITDPIFKKTILPTNEHPIRKYIDNYFSIHNYLLSPLIETDNSVLNYEYICKYGLTGVLFDKYVFEYSNIKLYPLNLIDFSYSLYSICYVNKKYQSDICKKYCDYLRKKLKLNIL